MHQGASDLAIETRPSKVDELAQCRCVASADLEERGTIEAS